jgi:hypothetical protein
VTTSPSTPFPFPVAIDDHPYLLDLASNQMRHRSIPTSREQADTTDEPGEQTVNREGMWRRSQSSWHAGSGQRYFDRPESSTFRYYTSFRVDPWTPWELSLLSDTEAKLTSSGAGKMAVAGTYLYVIDGTNIKFTTSLSGVPTWTTVTGMGASTFLDIVSDGYTVYATNQTDVYSTTRGAASGSVYNTLDCTRLGYVKGRLMASFGASLYNITSGAAPAALYTHPNSDWNWRGIAGGPQHIYVAGYAGDKSLIYRTAIKPDGTALDIPQVAGELPSGEVVTALYGYLGLLFIASTKGVRMATIDSSGDLTVGALIETPNSVLCLEGQGQYVWYGLSNYTSEGGTNYLGLGRLDPTVITDRGAPAYAPDLMATGFGDISSIVTFAGKRVFTVSGSAIHAETGVPVATGYLTTGHVSWGLADPKILSSLAVRHEALVGTVAAARSIDGGAYTTLGTSSTASSLGATFSGAQARGELVEFKFTLTPSGGVSPTLSRWTAKAIPVADTGERRVVPLLLTDNPIADGQPIDPAPGSRNPQTELTYLKGLHANQTVVTYQECGQSYTVTIEDYEWFPHHLVTAGDVRSFTGTFVAVMKDVE